MMSPKVNVGRVRRSLLVLAKTLTLCGLIISKFLKKKNWGPKNVTLVCHAEGTFWPQYSFSSIYIYVYNNNAGIIIPCEWPTTKVDEFIIHGP